MTVRKVLPSEMTPILGQSRRGLSHRQSLEAQRRVFAPVSWTVRVSESSRNSPVLSEKALPVAVTWMRPAVKRPLKPVKVVLQGVTPSQVRKTPELPG